MDEGGEKDLEPVPRSVFKGDTDADSELKEGEEKGMGWKGVAPCLFFALFAMREEKGSSQCRRQQVHGLNVRHGDM